MIPQTGDLVRVRSRQYLVEGVDLPPSDRTALEIVQGYLTKAG